MLSEAKEAEVRKLLAEGKSGRLIADLTGVGRSIVGNIDRGERNITLRRGRDPAKGRKDTPHPMKFDGWEERAKEVRERTADRLRRCKSRPIKYYQPQIREIERSELVAALMRTSGLFKR